MQKVSFRNNIDKYKCVFTVFKKDFMLQNPLAQEHNCKEDGKPKGRNESVARRKANN